MNYNLKSIIEKATSEEYSKVDVLVALENMRKELREIQKKYRRFFGTTKAIIPIEEILGE